MAFELPDLDTRSGQQLLAELMRRIPMFTPLWTDFNDSDPGITLLQMLCWIDECLLYQANAIPIQTQRNFLRWCLGLDSSTNVTPYSTAATQQNDFAFLDLQAVLARMEAGTAYDSEQLQAAVLTFLSSPYLALTCPEVETLAMQTNRVIAAEKPTVPPAAQVQRADAMVGDQDIALYILDTIAPVYQRPSPANPSWPDANGVLRTLLLLQPADTTARRNQLLDQVRKFLAPRVLLGTRIRVLAARRTPISLTVRVRCQANVKAAMVLEALNTALFDYFQPGSRWRYGQAPDPADLRHLVMTIPGIAAVTLLSLSYTPTALVSAQTQLGANSLIAQVPQTPPAMEYVGLPLLRCLDLFAQETGA